MRGVAGRGGPGLGGDPASESEFGGVDVDVGVGPDAAVWLEGDDALGAVDFERGALGGDLGEAGVDEGDAVVAEVEGDEVGVGHLVGGDELAVEFAGADGSAFSGVGGEAGDGLGGSHDADDLVEGVDAHVVEGAGAGLVEP